jgi:putative hydrolase of HD superfamily
MCLIHDLAESIVGDLTPSDQVSKQEKLEREKVNLNFNTGFGLISIQKRNSYF